MSEKTLLPNRAGDEERRLRQQRDRAAETLTRSETERLAALRERDAARQAAWYIAESVLAGVDWERAEKIRARLHERWPWLKEAGGETPSPGESD